MPRPESHHPELSEAEKRDVIKLVEEGRPLPDKYRFLLFEDKREVELVWNGKSRDVCSTVLPFQTLEHVDEPRREAPAEGELALDTAGRQLQGWANKLIWGDNKLILSSLKSGALRRQIDEAGGLKLIYIDPPFDVGADFSMDIEIGGETFHKEPTILEQIAYRDTWGRGADSFLAMIYERLILMRDLLNEEGSIYVHCDWRVTAMIRQVLDEVFGNRFRNEIIWKRTTSHSEASKYGQIHDTIYFYAKTESYVWNPQFTDYDDEYIAKYFRFEDTDGRKYWKEDASGAGPGPARRFGDRVIAPPKGRHWRWTQEKIDDLFAAGRFMFTKSGRPEFKRYLDEQEGAYVCDIWDDVKRINQVASERTGYATQKPEALLERIIKASSNEGDLVADFFCGSGTTAAVAEKLGRKWIATDLGKFAIHTTRKRMIQVQRDLKQGGERFRAFEIHNLGRYERQAFLNVSGNLRGKAKQEALARKEREFRELILRAYAAKPLETEEFFHGQCAGRLVVVGPVNLPVGRLFVEEVVTECRKRGATRADILAFEFEMGLFPAVLDEAKRKGIDLAPKIIPPEVFDKRAVDRGQVRFADVAYVEAAARPDPNDPFTVSIELTDFSVFYSQGRSGDLAESLKPGKSEVVCERGELIKVSKDKQGNVAREPLTREWTDWIDYWAVDFDYESRREIVKVPKNMGVDGELPGVVDAASGEFIEYEERWTGAYIFENEWQSFRTRKNRELELVTAPHAYDRPGRYTVAVKVIDIFGNDTMTLVPVGVS